MTIYELHTNDGHKFIQSTNERLTKAMYEYIRRKRKEGMALQDIVFCWTRHYVGRI